MNPSTAPNKRVESTAPLTLKSSKRRGHTLRKVLLACGILTALWYVVMNIYAPMKFPGYKIMSQTVSELSAIGAPTKQLWHFMSVPYILLVIAFGAGVVQAAGDNRRLATVGNLLVISGVLDMFWPPMHLRGAAATMTDTMHIVFSGVMLVLMLLIIYFGAAALGKRFRIYSILTLVVFLVFGTLTGLEAPNLAANLPTPMIGVWERINIGAYMLWLMVLALVLLNMEKRTGFGQKLRRVL